MYNNDNYSNHDDIIKWKHFLHYYKRDVYGVCERLAEGAQFNSSTSLGLLVPPIPSSGKHQSYITHTQHTITLITMMTETPPPPRMELHKHHVYITGPLCGEFTGHREFPSQRPVTQSFDIFFDLRLNKLLSKQSRRRWFEMPLHSLWHHCNVHQISNSQKVTSYLSLTHKLINTLYLNWEAKIWGV